MKRNYWILVPVQADPHYIPDSQEMAEMAQIEEMQKKCEHENFNSEDGCQDCGYYSK